MNELSQIKEFLPFLIPIVIIEIGLLIYAIRHILTHNTYKIGNRAIWLAVTVILMNFIGPILYLVLGKEDS